MPVAGSNAKGAAGAGSALKVRGLLMVPVRVTFGGTVSFKLSLALQFTDVSYSILDTGRWRSWQRFNFNRDHSTKIAGQEIGSSGQSCIELNSD